MNISKNLENLQVQRLDASRYNEVLQFIEAVFHVEQGIPKADLPLNAEKQMWWCIEKDDLIIATAAVWKKDGIWYWGRLAVHPDYRNQGLGTKIVQTSFIEIFQMNIDLVYIDARDLTIPMISKIGGEIAGPLGDFYGNITAMELSRANFQETNKP